MIYSLCDEQESGFMKVVQDIGSNRVMDEQNLFPSLSIVEFLSTTLSRC